MLHFVRAEIDAGRDRTVLEGKALTMLLNMLEQKHSIQKFKERVTESNGLV